MQSGFVQEMEGQGYELRWSRPAKIVTRKIGGYEFIYEVAPLKRRVGGLSGATEEIR